MIVAGSLVAALLAESHVPRWRGRRDVLALVTALVGGATAMCVAPEAPAPGLRVVLVVLAAAAVIDVRTLRIPNSLSFVAGVSALAAWLGEGAHPVGLLVTAVVALLMIVAFVVGGAGGGDVKMLPALVLAVITPLRDVALSVMVSSALLATVFAIALLTHLLSGAGMRMRSALAPAMLLAGIGALTLSGSLHFV